jgi:diguanylate cyclase (GGDEF)-like protein/PAS domain S-box-containing protein
MGIRFSLPHVKVARFAREETHADENQSGQFGPVRLTIFCAAILIVIVVITAIVAGYNFRLRTITENQQKLSQSVLILSNQLEQIFSTIVAAEQNITEDISPSSAKADFDFDARLRRYELRNYLSSIPYLHDLAIFDGHGHLINTLEGRTAGSSDVGASILEATTKGQRDSLIIGTPRPVGGSGRWILPLMHTILGPNGHIVGVVSADLDLLQLEKYFSEISVESGTGVALFRSDGMLLARFPEGHSEIGRQFPRAVALKLTADASHGDAMSQGAIDGLVRMVAAHRIEKFPMVVTATRANTFISAAWKKGVVYIAGAAALMVSVILGFASIIVRLFRSYQTILMGRAERDKLEQLREQSLRFDVALNNMSQGLVMFDDQSRVVLCNASYIELYGVSPEIVKPGLSLFDLLRHRKETGSFSGNPDQYCAKLLTQIAKRKLTDQNVRTPGGRTIKIVNQPMRGGGWVATHEDLTEKIEAESEISQQKQHLTAALQNVSQGVCMFDTAQRLIVCNKQYADLYGLSDEQTKPGTPLKRILEHRIATGNAPEDPETYIRDRLNEVSINQPYETVNRLRDGRYVAVVHRPMASGGWVATHQDITEARSREESFRLLFESNPVPMWVFDRSSLRFLAVNEAAVTIYGYSREQFMAMTVVDLRPPEDRARFASFIRSLSDEQFHENVGQHCKADGTSIDVAVCSRALVYNEHDARLAAIHDISKIKEAEGALRRTKMFLDAVVEHVPVPIAVRAVSTDARSDRFTLFNRAYEELTGDSRDRLIGKTPHEIFPTDRADLIVRFDEEALLSDHVIATPEHEIETARYGRRLIVAKKTAIPDENGQPQYLLTVMDDITDRRRAEQHIAHLAHNDSLTGLPNRASCLEYLSKALDKASEDSEQLAVMCLDLDRFKEANDIYGHLVGDGLLREVAGRLEESVQGAFLARIGGDEFIVVLRAAEVSAAAAQLGERLVETFRRDFEVDGHHIQVGLSVGVAMFPHDGDNVKTLIANADAALYQAKSEVRGSVRFFEAKLSARLREHRELQADLRLALKQDHQLHLYYQPQKTIGSNELVGFEALARWQCPKRGMVAPGTFIPVAEQCGLIVPLGEWILREACREAATWSQPLRIAVNISPVQFYHGDLARLVHSVLLETGLSPNRLELEITEGVLIDDFSRAVSVLRKLKALGVHIAMDDFGSGYSSLSYLHAFPFEKIKIDRAFINDLETNHHCIAIVRAIITLGHSLNIPILAEGVETQSQLNFLAKEKCDEVQGFLIGKPGPIAIYNHLIRSSDLLPRAVSNS